MIAPRALRADTLAPLFLAGLGHVQVREACEAALDLKLSRIHVRVEQIRPVQAWCKSVGLTSLVSSFSVQENLRDEGKGQWWNTGRRLRSGGGVKYLYVGLSRAAVRLFRRLEVSPAGNHAHIADLLRIPPCCCAAYVQQRDRARTKYHDDYAPLINAGTTAPGPYPWQLNYIGQYFGYSLIHYYPCTWTCRASLHRANASAEMIRKVSQEWLLAHARVLRGVVVLEANRAVHLISGSIRGGALAYSTGGIHSTRNTPFVDHLRRHRKLVWQRGSSRGSRLMIPFA